VEFPHLESLVEKYGRKGLVVVTLNITPESNGDGVEFMTRKAYRFTNLTAPFGGWGRSQYEVQGAPTTVLLDQLGRVILRHEGFNVEGMRTMEVAIKRLLQRGAQSD
jgi:thiol-disulfide isomerase/thioredoxin